MTEKTNETIEQELILEFLDVLGAAVFNHPEIYQVNDVEAVKKAQRTLFDSFLAGQRNGE